MFVLKDFVRDCFIAQICANSGARGARMHILAHICATKQSRTKSFSTNIGTIPKNMLTNCELKRLLLKPKLDIAKKPENRVHELTDSNVSLVIASNSIGLGLRLGLGLS